MANIQVRVYADGRTAYRVRVRRHGLGISRQFPTKGEAQAFAFATEEDFDGRAPAESSKLAMLIDKYREIAPSSYGRECLAHRRDKIGHLRAGEVTSAIIGAHRDELARTPAKSHNYKTARVRSPTTVRKYLIKLGAVFKFATRELDWSIDNPVKKVSKPEAAAHRVRFLSVEERANLLEAARRSDSPHPARGGDAFP